MTIKEALDVSGRSVSSRDAEIFLQNILNVNRAFLQAHLNDDLSDSQATEYRSFLDRRESNEPVAYIIGHREFYGRPFKTDKRVLIPRPETEGLIDLVLDWAPQWFSTHTKVSNKPCPVRILELGTGSGNIAVTIALELAKRQTPIQLIATDVSSPALELAKENWNTLKAENTSNFPVVHFVEANLFSHQLVDSRKPYHLIVANLPYVPTTWQSNPDAQVEVVFQEPDVALFGGKDGLDVYREFFKKAAGFLADDGKVLVEYGEDETDNITKLAEDAFSNKKIVIHKDYAGLDRILEITAL